MEDALDNYAHFEELLKEHGGLPKEQLKRSFLEIARLAERENVHSNILAFFLNPENEHGLKDLLIQALFEASGISDADDVASAEVETEVSLPSGERIDLVVSTNDHIIAIENKIHHHLDNDLLAYAGYIEKRAKEGQRVLCVVLSLHDKKRR
jgi:hypothetical protein